MKKVFNAILKIIVYIIFAIIVVTMLIFANRAMEVNCQIDHEEFGYEECK